MSDRPTVADWLAAVPGLRRVGGEYHGPCPSCREGDDRFRVLDSGAAFCRVCAPDAAGYPALLDAAGLNGSAAQRPVSRIPLNGAGKLAGRWTARDYDGGELGTHTRYDLQDGRKSFPWTKGVKPRELPLYRSEHHAGGELAIVEGEKSADALAGALADSSKLVTLFGAAPSVLGTYGSDTLPSSSVLAELVRRTREHSRVYLWPDNDGAGRKHMAQLAKGLIAAGADRADLRLIQWAEAPPKGDAADWLAGGCVPTWQELEKAAGPVDAAAASAGAGATISDTRTDTMIRSEADLGKWFVEKHGADRLYRSDGQWFRWSTGAWTPDHESTGELMTHGRTTFVRLDKNGADKWDPATGGRRSTASGALAFAQGKLWSPAADWDADPWLVGAPGGAVVDLRTGEVRGRTRADLIERAVSAAPTPSGWRGSRWAQFLAETFPADVQDWLRTLCGYALTGWTREHVLLFIYGPTGAGKGTFLTALGQAAGSYARRIEPSDLMATRGSAAQHPAWLADLRGRRLIVADELPRGQWDSPRVKALVSGEPIRARAIAKDYFEFKPEAQVIVAGNHAPMQDSADTGLVRRLRVLKADNQVAAEAQDKHLPARLLLGDVLAWAIEGAAAYADAGLPADPPSVLGATRKYAEESDALSEFLATVTIWPAPCSHLYARYREWAEGAGLRYPLGKQRFNATLREDYQMVAVRPAGERLSWRRPEKPAALLF